MLFAVRCRQGPNLGLANWFSSKSIEPTHLGWAVGTLGVSLQLNTFAITALFFMVTVLKIEPVIAGALITGSKLYDAVTDPLMGYVSDRTRSRWGRRRPYLLMGGLTCGACFALVFSIPPMPDTTVLYWYVGGALLLLSTAYTIFNVPYLAMPAEMIDDYHERSVMMSYRVFLISIGTFIGISVAPALVALLQESQGYTPSAAYRAMGLTIGAMMVVAMVASFFGTRGARFAEPKRTELPWRERARLLFGNVPFLLYMGLKLAGLFALAAVLAVQLFFIVYVMERSMAIAGIYGAVQITGQILSIPLWLRLSKRVGKIRVLVISSVVMLVFAGTWFLSGPDESLFVYGLRGLALGIGGAGTLLATQAMLPDVMEYDRRRTGMRREGVYAGLASFIEKISSALSGVVIGGLLSAMGFDRNLGPEAQPDSARTAIYICIAVIPMATYALKLVLLYFFNLDEKTLKSATSVVEPAPQRAGDG
jgi:GPH family glycoside/pentoside/hexuronide:cation symporter